MLASWMQNTGTTTPFVVQLRRATTLSERDLQGILHRTALASTKSRFILPVQPVPLYQVATGTPQSTDNLKQIICIGFVMIGVTLLITNAIDRRTTLHNHLAQLNGHATLLVDRFQTTGNLADITEAINVLQNAVGKSPNRSNDLPIMLTNLGSALKYRFERRGEIPDIDASVLTLEQAVRLTPMGSASLPVRLHHLATSLQLRIHRTGDPEGVSRLNETLQAAKKCTPAGDPIYPHLMDSLGNYMVYLSSCTRDVRHITQAILIQRKAVALVAATDPMLPNMLNNLGTAFCCRFQVTGNPSDITEAINTHHRALEASPEGHLSMSDWLYNIGQCYLERHFRTGELTDVSEAIYSFQQAVDATPDDHGELPTRLNALGVAFTSRFCVMRDPSDIERAVLAGKQAVELALDEARAELPSWLSNLGTALSQRFKDNGNLPDIDEAISLHQRAVGNTPDNHAELGIRLNNLGIAFCSRFGRTKALTDIDASIAVGERAARLTQPGDANLPIQLSNLGQSLYDRFRLLSSKCDLDSSIDRYRSVAVDHFGSPRVRLRAARNWAHLLVRHYPQKSQDIVDAFESAIGLVTLVAGLEQTVKGRCGRLTQIDGLASEAAAAACSLNRPDKALEWLEQGRCLIWTQLNHLRSPLDDLHVQNDELAKRFRDTAMRLENAGSSQHQLDVYMTLPQKIRVEKSAREQIKLAEEWKNLVETIRTIPGFEAFLQPRTCQSLVQGVPENGVVIVVSVNEERGHAIAIIAGSRKPVQIPLPGFALATATKYRADITAQLRTHGLRLRRNVNGKSLSRSGGLYRRSKKESRSTVVQDILRGLWSKVVKPILDALEIPKRTPTSPEELPRIWWCPTGPLSSLPLHAAGIYGTSASECVPDYAVCSYAPSVTALTERVKNCKPIDESCSGIFLTCQPNAIPQSRIPGTTKEVREICHSAGEYGVRTLHLEGDDVGIEDCLAHMENYSSIHLACHALQDTEEPLRSRFQFHKGSFDLSTIIQRNLRNADLAFLSACQTSTGDEKLSDEAVHLAAGMLAAGYRRVVATMWAIGDKHAPKVALDFTSISGATRARVMVMGSMVPFLHMRYITLFSN
ncbi:hypothetical protein NMY22_g7415 [Coprinellus aureogranulatus]|nr:hypothetical protein NMY22_g7415 [Coprinellus aureogranulatus]